LKCWRISVGYSIKLLTGAYGGQLLHEPNKMPNRLMKSYNWEQKNWLNFTYSIDNLEDVFFLFAEETGKVTGMLGCRAHQLQAE
jgi:hypothetical protein